MAYGINGSLEFSIEPAGSTSSTSLNKKRQWSYGFQQWVSANEPIEYTLLWTNGTTVNEGTEPLASNYNSTTQKGDVVNVIFDIYTSNDKDLSPFTTEWALTASIRKSRDMRNLIDGPNADGGGGTMVATGHRFTIDISEIMKDEISYSLVPLGKGTWTNWKWGGLNGTPVPQDNVAVPVWQADFIQSQNGAYRWVRVKARTEILDGDGLIQEATASGSTKTSMRQIAVINSILDRDGNEVDGNGWYSAFVHGGWSSSSTYARIMQSRAPNYAFNHSWGYGPGSRRYKDVRPGETGEYLQWIQNRINNNNIWHTASSNPEGVAYGSGNTSDLTANTYMEVTAYDKDGSELRSCRLFDWVSNLKPKTQVNGQTEVYERGQDRVCVQNVSIPFINANAIWEDSTIQAIWEKGGTLYTRHQIDTVGTTRGPDALFINDEVSYYRTRTRIVSCEDGQVGPPNVQGTIKNISEARWYRVDMSRTHAKQSTERWGGMYYTELRSDATTNAKHIGGKALSWWSSESPYVRFYWLNTAGGIDSYTCKGPRTKGFTIEKDVILKNQGNPTNFGIGMSQGNNPYPQKNAITTSPNTPYKSDTIRGQDNHRGGREVLRSTVDRVGSASTELLAPDVAEWVREIATSPNVWIEVNQQKSLQRENAFYKIAYKSLSDIEKGANMDGRTPNNFVYVPVVITNSDVITEDETGAVSINFDYIHSHPVKTQTT